VYNVASSILGVNCGVVGSLIKKQTICIIDSFPLSNRCVQPLLKLYLKIIPPLKGNIIVLHFIHRFQLLLLLCYFGCSYINCLLLICPIILIFPLFQLKVYRLFPLSLTFVIFAQLFILSQSKKFTEFRRAYLMIRLSQFLEKTNDTGRTKYTQVLTKRIKFGY
jgi:hypothetical protein